MRPLKRQIGFCPIAQVNKKQTLKEPVLPSFKKTSLKIFESEKTLTFVPLNG
jgi:hypothetical protein